MYIVDNDQYLAYVRRVSDRRVCNEQDGKIFFQQNAAKENYDEQYKQF
jgi:hypothetical protein